jgi:N6-adenosine-specific RNA methylase IME4
MRLLAYGGQAQWPFGDLVPHSYGMMMIDPPWDFSLHSIKGGNKSAQKHYRCLPLDQIMAFPVQDLAAPDCLCMLWATAPMLDQQMRVLKHWGFTYKTEMIWRKVTKTGKQTFGPGYITRGSHEIILIGTKGAPKLTHKKNIRSCFDGIRRRHSEKPEEAYVIAERMMPKAMRIEIFSRTTRKGWHSWGDQVGLLDEGGAPVMQNIIPVSMQGSLF